MNEIYLKNCLRCPGVKKKPHCVYRINVLRGTRLRCMVCGHICQRYCDTSKLKIQEQTE